MSRKTTSLQCAYVAHSHVGTWQLVNKLYDYSNTHNDLSDIKSHF